MCDCHDPYVFGHRCHNESSGDYYAPDLGSVLGELGASIATVIAALDSIFDDDGVKIAV